MLIRALRELRSQYHMVNQLKCTERKKYTLLNDIAKDIETVEQTIAREASLTEYLTPRYLT